MTFISNSSPVRPHAGIQDSRPTRRTWAVGARFTPRQTRVESRRRKLSAERHSSGADIWLLDGATGKNCFCSDYDVSQQRCRVWAHTVDHSAPKKKAANGETSHTAASPARHLPRRKQRKEKSHEEAVDECCVHRSGGKHCAG
jgi:hypothetical protein